MSKNRAHPVFFDPNNKRWPRLRRGVYLTGLALTVLFGMLILSILISPALLPLKFPGQEASAHVTLPDPKIETPEQRRLRIYKQKLEAERLKRAQAVKLRPNPKPASNSLGIILAPNFASNPRSPAICHCRRRPTVSPRRSHPLRAQ